MVDSSSSTFTADFAAGDNDFINNNNSHQKESSTITTTEANTNNNDTIRLDYCAISRCGIRQKELNTLLRYASADLDQDKPAVWLEAEPGAGKSALLQQFRDQITARGHAITICGKFEERAAASEPFKALREAIAELAQYILKRENRQAWCQDLQERVGDDMELVKSILPCLGPCFHSRAGESPCGTTSEEDDIEEKYEESGEDAFGNMSNKEYRFVRFRLAYRSLIRLACDRLYQDTRQTLLFLLDDLHWIDQDSLQIIKTLMEDPKKRTNFFLLAATRPLDEVAHIHDLYQSMALSALDSSSRSNVAVKRSMRFSTRSSAHKRPGSSSPVEKLKVLAVERLSIAEIRDILKALLGREDTDPLAKIVKEKTQGNMFVVVQFLRLLERNGHLYYSHDKQQWKFDAQRIERVDQISDNVSQIVAQSLEAGDRRRRSALMVAASFGVSQFDVTTIVHAVTVLDKDEEGNSSEVEGGGENEDPYVVRRRVMEMSCELNEAVLEGYVEQTKPGHFRFAHDRIRESAYSLLPDGNSRKEVHLRVGRQLRSWMDTQSELGLTQSGFSKESLLLHATKQLNAGADLIRDDWELLDLVDLNYQAAELAANKTAFFSSIEYLQLGLSHLGEKDAWTKHYDRALKFHVALTRMQYSCGLLDECWETSVAVVTHARSFRDKSGIYHTRILCLMQNELMDEAMNLALEVFDMMGKPMPRRFVIPYALKDMLKARKFLKRTSDEELLNLPTVHDEDLQMEFDFLFTLIEADFLSRNAGYVMLVPIQLVLLVAERGNFPRSFFATGLWAVFFKAQVCDFKEAMHYGSLATKLCAIQRSLVPGYAARWDFAFEAFIRHWQAPILQSVTPIADAFQRLWGSGLIDTYLMDVGALLQHYFAAGETVDKTLKECIRCSEAFEDYQQMYYWHANATQHQTMLNFQGKCDNPAILNGQLMNAESCKENWAATSNKAAIFNYQFWSIVLGYHFGDLQRAKQNIKAMRKDLMEDGPTVLVPLTVFYTSLVYLSLYKETRKSKYRSRAYKSWKKLKGWAKKGAVNCVYMCHLLQAEDLSSKSRPNKADVAMEAYEDAIKSVTEAGLLHHMALANELAGIHLLSRSDEDRASSYLQSAVQLYSKWGAVAKVDSMESKYSKYLATAAP